jgi:hypothetical protein
MSSLELHLISHSLNLLTLLCDFSKWQRGVKLVEYFVKPIEDWPWDGLTKDDFRRSCIGYWKSWDLREFREVWVKIRWFLMRGSEGLGRSWVPEVNIRGIVGRVPPISVEIGH